MRGKQFSWLFSGASALGAFLGVILISGRMNLAAYQPTERILLTGGIFTVMFLIGFLMLQFARP